MALGEGLEDLYVEKKSNKNFYIILAVVFIVLIAFWVFSASNKTIQIQGLIDKCEQLMLETKSAYTVCCMENDNLVDCTERKAFNYNDFVITQANLLLLNQNLDRFHACVFYTPLETKAELLPGKTALLEYYTSGEAVLCSKRLGIGYINVENHGTIKNRGRITLMRIYIFESGLYNKTIDFAKNLDKGTLVLNLTAVVE